MESVTKQSGQTQQEINISYETLFELLRIAKNRDDLQQLPPSFFEDVIAYLREKQMILDESRAKEDLFSLTEREKASTELLNIKKILRELYERREKKIINLALNKSRTSSDIIDTSKLLNEERQLFNQIVNSFDVFRQGILMNVLDLRLPLIRETEEEKEESPSQKQEENNENNPPANKETRLVRFIHPVPKFMGKELEVYGPFEEEDMATFPSEIANVLIEKGRAEEIAKD